MSPVRDTDDPQTIKVKKKKSTKGWDGELLDPASRNTYLAEDDGEWAHSI